MSGEKEFRDSVEDAVNSGLPFERLLEIVYESWAEKKPKPEFDFTPCLNAGGMPIVNISWGPIFGSVPSEVSRAMGFALIWMADHSEMLASANSYFAKARDKALAEKIKSGLFSEIEALRRSNFYAQFIFQQQGKD